MEISGSDMDKPEYIRGDRGIIVNQGGKGRCSRELGDRFGANKKEAQVEYKDKNKSVTHTQLYVTAYVRVSY